MGLDSSEMVAVAVLALLFTSRQVERRVLLPFDYQQVRITGGMLQRQVEDAKEFYLRIPNDDLLLGFRRRAGLPAPGQELGGWYSDDVFHIFGQILSGLARLYAATDDLACKEKADALLEGWAKTIASDGYFYYSAKPNAPHYIFDKMAGGLVDMATYCGRKDALDDLSRITDWAIKNLDRSHKWLDGGEWYTLSENLYRAYALTGDTKYRDFAKVWEYTTYWSAYAEHRDLFAKQPDGNQTDRYHAYSHVNTLGGAAWAYRTTGEAKYLATIENAYDYLRANQCFATGGFGPDESILPPDQLPGRLKSTESTYETQCGSWAIFKLCKNLIAITGDAKYGDWIEEAVYNGVAATIPESPSGNVFYYSDYNPLGATKFNNETRWTCCAGTRPMAAADIDDLIYFKAPDGVDVNLFLPSSVSLDNGATVTQRTRFPEEPATELVVDGARGGRFTVRVRRPGWSQTPPTATVNGRPIHWAEDKKHWIGITRNWQSGDVARIEFPMTPRAVPLQPGKAYPTAVAVGPVVLAFRSADGTPAAKVDLAHLPTALTPSPGETLTYQLVADPAVLARPFYAYKEGEEYYLYLDPSVVGQVPFNRMKRGGHWNAGGRFYWSSEAGAWMEGTFTGDSVRLIGWAFDDAGKATVTVDGKVVETIDQYGAGRDLPWDWHRSGFGPGRHVLRVTVLHQKQEASKDSYVNVGGLSAPAGS